MKEESTLSALIAHDLATSRSATIALEHLTDPHATRAFKDVAAASWHSAEVLRQEMVTTVPATGAFRARAFESLLSLIARVSDTLALRFLERHLTRHSRQLRVALEALGGRRRELVLQLVFPAHSESRMALRVALAGRSAVARNQRHMTSGSSRAAQLA